MVAIRGMSRLLVLSCCLLLWWSPPASGLPIKESTKGRSLPLVISQYSNVGIANRNSKNKVVAPPPPSPAAEPPASEPQSPAVAAATPDATKSDPINDQPAKALEQAEPAVSVNAADQGQETKLAVAAASDETKDKPVVLEDGVKDLTKTSEEEAPKQQQQKEEPVISDLQEKLPAEPVSDEKVTANEEAKNEESSVPKKIETNQMDDITAEKKEDDAVISPKEKTETERDDKTEQDSKADVTTDSSADAKVVADKTADEIVDPAAGEDSESTENNNQMLPVLRAEELVEEDRSFKGSLEQFNPAEAVAQQRASQAGLDRQLVGEDDLARLDDLVARSDELNGGVRLERDGEKIKDVKETILLKEKEKDKEKILKPTKETKETKEAKETKPVKPSKASALAAAPVPVSPPSDDPVQEYEEPSRAKRFPEDTESEPKMEVISLVPDNYPVVLPNGKSALSDQVNDDEVPAVLTLVPDNYPVVLPNGESTLSDKVKDIPTPTQKNNNENEE